MKLINDQPAVAVKAIGWEDLEERRDDHVRLVEEGCDEGLERLVPRRRAPAPVAGWADGGCP